MVPKLAKTSLLARFIDEKQRLVAGSTRQRAVVAAQHRLVI
jgi:hypothetical protein